MIVVRDPLELVQAFRARADLLDLPRELIDDLAGLARGHSSKLLATPPIKGIGPITMFPLAGALGFSIALIEDERRMVRINAIPRSGYKRRPFAQEWRNAKALGMMREMLVTYGKIGMRQRRKLMTDKEYSEHQSQAAKARWRKWRRERRLKAIGSSAPPPATPGAA